MTFTYNPASGDNRDVVRLLIHDTDTATAANQLFTDAEIDAFLTLEGSVVRRAAAAALESLAANQAMVLKVIRMLDLSTDGAAVARELRMQATALRDQAEADAAASGGFDIAEQVVDAFTLRERTWKQAMRGAL